jgi:hypothetical protein
MELFQNSYEREYRVFLDDLLTEYKKYKFLDFKDIPFYGDLFFRDWRTNIKDDRERYLDLVAYYYDRYQKTIVRFQKSNSKKEIKNILKYSKNIIPPYGIIFHQMYWVVHDAAYFSISRLMPEMHKVNTFFIAYFNDPEPIMPHHKIFNFQYTPTSPWFRDYIRNYANNFIAEVENVPLFVLFLCPRNLTEYGEENIFALADILGKRMDDYSRKNNSSILRGCLTKYGNLDYRKLQRKLKDIVRESENELRSTNHLPAVGDGWLEEIKLYYRIKDDLPNCVVVCHGKPLFLRNQHYDIWIPDYKIAVEFQGEQHRRPIEYFGGETAFIAQQERDERKRQLSIENGVTLLYAKEGYNYPELLGKIKKIIFPS